MLPGVIDRHVHLGLCELSQLTDGPLVEVHDLGWSPDGLDTLLAQPPAGVTVRVCGRFHAAPGGYPSGREWAPVGSVREVRDAADARAAVAEARRMGSSGIKITLHTEFPLPDDHTLRALVAAAHAAGLPAVVHAEGTGQAERAIGAGADILAHTPWTERLSEQLLHQTAEQGMVWLSSLAIHTGESLAVVLDNARGFLAAGGMLRYGTDMGNGPTPFGGVNGRELELLDEVGLRGDELITAVCGAEREIPADRALWSPHPVPQNATQLNAWLADATRLDYAAT